MRSVLSRSGVLLFSLLAGTAWADTAVPLSVTGNEARGEFSLPGGLGADLTIAFEQVVGLNPAALEVTVGVVSPTDPILLRLPGSTGLPAGFPVRLAIEPSESSALSFQGTVMISLHSHNLILRPNFPLSLFAASAGGPFSDITRSEGIGSYRVSGTKGGFSEFMIVLDTRAIDSVIVAKFNDLASLIDSHESEMAPGVAGGLEARLTQARTAYLTGQTVAAIAELAAFSNDVKAQSGVGIPDVWRAHDPRVNVAGSLRAASDTLQFSLNRKSSLSP